MDWTQRLRIRQLHVLVALYETRNVSHTAERLSMTQPALSRWLAELESELGVSLFERHSRGLVPTRFCAALVVHARTILSEIARTQDTIRVMADGAAGQLAIGATPTVAVDLLPDAIRRFREAFPQPICRLPRARWKTCCPRCARAGSISWSGAPRCKASTRRCAATCFMPRPSA